MTSGRSTMSTPVGVRPVRRTGHGGAGLGPRPGSSGSSRRVGAAAPTSVVAALDLAERVREDLGEDGEGVAHATVPTPAG